jgi:hypothetical protein
LIYFALPQWSEALVDALAAVDVLVDAMAKAVVKDVPILMTRRVRMVKYMVTSWLCL